MAEAFRQAHAHLMTWLDELTQISVELGVETWQPLLAEMKDKLEKEQFYLVVLGEGKRGKSTFINALLGYPLLPAGVVPVTGVVTLVRFGSEPYMEVHFQDSRPARGIKSAALWEYISEEANPENQKGVERVEIACPAPFLSWGITLVDTPGVGSVFEHNTEVTRAFLPRADAAVFVFSVDPPLNRAELEWLAHVREQVPHLFLVQNKIDYLPPGEQAQAETFAWGQIRGHLGQEHPVFAISALQALQAKAKEDAGALEAAGLPSFETALEDYFHTGRAGLC